MAMAKKLNWLCRFLFTALAFLFWAVAGTLLQLVLLPYARKHKTADLATPLQGRNWVGKIWFYFIRYLAWTGTLGGTYHGF